VVVQSWRVLIVGRMGKHFPTELFNFPWCQVCSTRVCIIMLKIFIFWDSFWILHIKKGRSYWVGTIPSLQFLNICVWKNLKTTDNTDICNREEFSWLLDLPPNLPVTHYINTGFSLNIKTSWPYYCKGWSVLCLE
jgi:hypothetical protein